MPAVPNPSEMFSDSRDGVEVAQRFEQYKSALSGVHAQYGQGGYMLDPEQGRLVKDHSAAPGALALLEKSLTPAQLAELGPQLAALGGVTADVAKDWSIPAAANNTNLVPYDLEGPAKLLVPRNTPLRNSTPRTKGQGLAVEFRRILGWTNSSTGGVADRLPFIDSQTGTETFGPMTLRRGPKIAYASAPKTVSYVEMGLSDQVNWKTQYASQGYQDIRQLSQTALLWAHMLGEEKAMLYGRGSAAKNYIGAVSAPVATVATSASGGAVAAGTYYVKVTAQGGGGESVPSTVVNTGALTGSTSQFTVTVATEPAGSTGYNLYIGTTSGAETYVASFSGKTYTVLATPATGGAAVPSADTTVSANGYDGFLPTLLDPAQSGYVGRVNGQVYNPTTPANSLGDAPWQDAFAALYGATAGPGGTKRQADPDEIWVDGNIRRKLGDWVKLSSNNTGYRIQLSQADAGGVTIGSAANAIQNQVTGKMVDLSVHPFMPNGCSVIRSRTLPVPDSEISNTSEVRCVQDYMSVDWPVVQFTYDASTYWFGTLVHYAPEWSGALVGLS